MTSSIYAQPSFGKHNQTTVPVDVEFVSGSVVVSAHQIVLAQRSDVFRLFFADLPKGPDGSSIVRTMMPTEDHEAFLRFVEFCYTGTLAHWPANAAQLEEILRLAKLYRVTPLYKLCERYLSTCSYITPTTRTADVDQQHDDDVDDEHVEQMRWQSGDYCVAAVPKTVEPLFAPAGAHNPLYKPLPPALAAAMIEAQRCENSYSPCASSSSSEDDEEVSPSSVKRRRAMVVPMVGQEEAESEASASTADLSTRVVLPPIRCAYNTATTAGVAPSGSTSRRQATEDRLLPLKKRLRSLSMVMPVVDDSNNAAKEEQAATLAAFFAATAAAASSSSSSSTNVSDSSAKRRLSLPSSDSDDEYDAYSRRLRSPASPVTAGLSSSPSASSIENSSASEDDGEEAYLEDEEEEFEEDADSEYYEDEEARRQRRHRRSPAKRPRVDRPMTVEGEGDEGEYEDEERSGACCASSSSDGECAPDSPLLHHQHSSSSSPFSGRHPPPDNCHHCKAKKKRWIGCPLVKTHRFCDRCLHRHFGASYKIALDQAEAGLLWRDGCPVCQVTCPCAICKRKKNKIDAGMEVRRGRPRKYPAKAVPSPLSSPVSGSSSKKRKIRS